MAMARWATAQQAATTMMIATSKDDDDDDGDGATGSEVDNDGNGVMGNGATGYDDIDNDGRSGRHHGRRHRCDDDDAVDAVVPPSSTKDEDAYVGESVAFEDTCVGPLLWLRH